MLTNYIVGPVAIIYIYIYREREREGERERERERGGGLPFSFVLHGWQTDIVQLAGLHKYRPLIFFFIFNQILFNHAFKKGNFYNKLYKSSEATTTSFFFFGQKPVQTGLAWFFGFGSVFSGLARFFSGFFGFGSVRFFRFQTYKTKIEPVKFFKILIGFFLRFYFFNYFFSVFSI
jgi:hypothetical protein